MSVATTGGYTARCNWTWSRVLLSGVLFLIAGLYLAVIADGKATLREFWFPVFLYLFPVLALVLRPQAPGVQVFTALFASLSVLFFEVFTEPLYMRQAPEWINRLVEYLSQSLMLLFPFTFVHFSLVFPAVGQWPERRVRRALLFIYVPLGTLLVLYAVALLAGADYKPLDSALIVVFPAGFLLGLAIFVRSYLYSLTSAEKNRLRVMLAGCLAGGLPIIFANMAGLHELADVARLLLPLFPLSLALAVLKEDFAEPGPIVEKVLRVSMVAAGGVSTFFLASLLLSLILDLPDRSLWLFSLLASLAMVVPLVRWSGSYVGSHFRLPLPEEWAPAAPRSASFEPISPNPYIVGNPVRTTEMFFGRADDFQFIRTKLEGQRQGCIVLLCGQRRAGKTSILYQVLNRRLGPDLLPVFLDMQELIVQNDREFVRALAVRIGRALEAQINPDVLSPASEIDDYLQFSAFLDQTMGAIGNSRLLLLFDEYELMGEKVREGRLSAELGDYLNSMLEKHARLDMVFTGSRPLDADPAFSRLLGKSFYREISFLALPDAVNLICSPVQGRVFYESQAISDLLLLTRGHPFFIQLLCQLLVELLNESHRTTVTRELVAEAVARVLESPPPQFLYTWSGYSREEKLVLAGLGTLLKRPASYLPADRLTRLIMTLPRQHRKELDSVEIRIILEDLRRKGALDRDQDRYGFTMDLLRRYIKAEHTVWSVLGEKTDH
ncbi:MAG: hypothetical protein EHM23_16790 [Acidobacteria bacterium]|nr:MAG: hypothetical protein EHM23_16790 [Acidobacteriota bacterium]